MFFLDIFSREITHTCNPVGGMAIGTFFLSFDLTVKIKIIGMSNIKVMGNHSMFKSGFKPKTSVKKWVKYIIFQGPTERSLFGGTFRGMFPYSKGEEGR